MRRLDFVILLHVTTAGRVREEEGGGVSLKQNPPPHIYNSKLWIEINSF